MFKVENGKIVQKRIPKVGTLKNGSTVSGYHLLPMETLLEEGWLPYEDIKPEYNSETHSLKESGYEILEDKVIRVYEIVELPPYVEPEPYFNTEKLLKILVGLEEPSVEEGV